MNRNNRTPQKNRFFIASVTALLLALSPLSFGQPAHAAAGTIAEIVSQSGGEFDRNGRDFDILLNAVVTAGLDGVLNDPSVDLTVFAPTDRAFIYLARDLGYGGRDEAGAFEFIVDALTGLGGGNPIPVLTDILTYHVTGGSLNDVAVARSESIVTLLTVGGAQFFELSEDATVLPESRFASRTRGRDRVGADRLRVRVTLVDNDPELRDPRIIRYASNISATNGVIHSIDRVLVPADLPGPNDNSLPTIAEIVASSGGDFDRNSRDFDILLNAVQAADPAVLAALNNRDANLTAFAPNDRAFILLVRELGVTTFSEDDAFNVIVETLTALGGGTQAGFTEVLTNILLYHVSPSALAVKDVVLSDSVETLLTGQTFRPDGTTLMDNEPALTDPVILENSSNIQAANGRVHTINRVLIFAEIVE